MCTTVQRSTRTMSAADSGMRGGARPYGSSIDRYTIFNCISHGSYGAVYRAWDINLGQLVAMKHEFGGFCPSTKRELEILKSLPRHRSIVEYRDEVVDERDGRVFVVMEYVPMDLKRFTDQREKPLTEMELRRVMKQILEGVEFIHSHGVMHRDLKPSNILVDREGEGGRLKICDFGSSRRLDRGAVFSPGNEVVTTLWYRAPELLEGNGRYTPAVDMWAVGCIMAELAVKQVLFAGVSERDQIRRIKEVMEAREPHHLFSLRMKLTLAASAADVPWLVPRGFDLLESLLEMDPSRRITATQALRHQWFTSY